MKIKTIAVKYCTISVKRLLGQPVQIYLYTYIYRLSPHHISHALHQMLCIAIAVKLKDEDFMQRHLKLP
jgi:hypothetical protein